MNICFLDYINEDFDIIKNCVANLAVELSNQ